MDQQEYGRYFHRMRLLGGLLLAMAALPGFAGGGKLHASLL